MNKLAVLAFALAPTLAAAQEGAVSQTVGHGQINWTDKTVTATGSGAPSLKAANVAVARLGAERAAKMDAFRNVLEAVRGIRLSGGATAGSAMDQSAETKSKVEGAIQGFKVVDTKYYSDGGVDVILQGPIDGVLADTLVGGAGSKYAAATGEETTGVVINAKGTGVQPALAPRLLDESGADFWSASMVSKEALRKNGMASYSNSLDQASKDARVGAKPVIIKATKAFEPGSADLVIAAADLEKLKKAKAALGEGKVIIVTD